jgi:hypothetical protein
MTKNGKRGDEGAVMVEFLAAFMPIFAFFLGLVQLVFIQTASLVVNHAAHVAVRAAVVVIPDKDLGAPGSASGAKKAAIERAARVPLSTLGLTDSDVDIKLDKASYKTTQTVTVTVAVDYTCRVPLGGLMACGGAKTTLTAEASMANQGADYVY